MFFVKVRSTKFGKLYIPILFIFFKCVPKISTEICCHSKQVQDTALFFFCFGTASILAVAAVVVVIVVFTVVNNYHLLFCIYSTPEHKQTGR